MSTGTPPAAQADALSLPEMLRIMDVATALRHDRELVEEQLNFDELKARLRAKLIDAAKATGEEVTEAEVDTAIDQYYRRSHVFHEPPWSLQLVLAHLYVRRNVIALVAALVLAVLGPWWVLFGTRRAPLSAAGRTHRQVEALAAAVGRRGQAIRAVARDDESRAELARLAAEAETFRREEDPQKLRDVEARLAGLEARLEEEYTIDIVADPNDPRKHNSVVRQGKVGNETTKGYYVFVQARRPDGTALTRRVHNKETERDEDVKVWAEQVPKEVYDRLGRDKAQDGILNETAFAVKKRGRTEEEVVMPGADGRPLARLGQITHW